MVSASSLLQFFERTANLPKFHGVYKPGNVKLHPELLDKHQKYVKEKTGSTGDKPVFLVFHGGSGSTKKEYTDAIGYGRLVDTELECGKTNFV